ncbi:hypothetical protein [Marilutibacter chinensis]|uniref:Uncharacterized protein n=1 Tax=Marilutibacter chinensis TaxID=2912247 RepID=A0ABS9HQH7_9GAMM|nr:hypothetical protein [Lysobacter chinensis]MCF7220489.1 hypothetical protein [Lysobacter chinensis]
MPQTTGPLPGPAAAAATSAPWTQVEVCGAAFGLPAGWRSRQLHSDHWRLAQESGQGVVVDVRCLPSLRFPNDRWDEIAEVAAALELGQADWPQQDQLRYLLWIEGRRDAVQGRVSNLIALRREPRETHSHGLRRQVALWPLDGDCDRDALPCSALLSMHWSADVPAQQAGYEALSAAMAQTLQLPEPNF